MATTTNTNNSNSSTKVIRIQDDEKELLFRLREIYGNDYKRYGEYIRRETNVPLSIKKIYKLLDERKAYRRISDYFHRERAAKKAKEPPSNGLNTNSFPRATTRGITQVPEQISSPPADHEMEDDDELDHPTQSPTVTNASDDMLERTHSMHDDDPIQSNQKRKRTFRTALPSSTDGKSNLLSIRSHLEKALNELDRAIICKDELIDDDPCRSTKNPRHFLLNGHRHSKLDDIVRSLSHVVNQQQENTRLIIDEASMLLADNSQREDEKPVESEETLRNVLDRLNALIDRGNSIYDRVESILSEF